MFVALEAKVDSQVTDSKQEAAVAAAKQEHISYTRGRGVIGRHGNSRAENMSVSFIFHLNHGLVEGIVL